MLVSRLAGLVITTTPVSNTDFDRYYFSMEACYLQVGRERAGYAFHTPANTPERLLCRGEARPALKKSWGDICFFVLYYTPSCQVFEDNLLVCATLGCAL